MKITIDARNDNEDYLLTVSDDGTRYSGDVELKIQQTGEDYYETWRVDIKELYEVVNLFDNRKSQ